jgi:hypothetical protein
VYRLYPVEGDVASLRCAWRRVQANATIGTTSSTQKRPKRSALKKPGKAVGAGIAAPAGAKEGAAGGKKKKKGTRRRRKMADFMEVPGCTYVRPALPLLTTVQRFPRIHCGSAALHDECAASLSRISPQASVRESRHPFIAV